MIENIGNFKDNTDGTVKAVYQINNNEIIEMSVLYNKIDKDVICVPTHYYCSLGCRMCHLTSNKHTKPMKAINIDNFMDCLIMTLKKFKTNKRKLLISFMGVGEPLLNIRLIEDVFKNEDIVKKIGYDYVSYAISTMMPNNNLLELTDLVNKLNMPLKVHFSLHNPIDKLRKELIPSTSVSVDEALQLLINYSNVVSKNKIIMDNYHLFHQSNVPIEIHYTLIKDVNDSDKELKLLIDLLKEYKIPIKFIKFNPNNDLGISEKEDYWVEEIAKNISNLRVKRYTPPGREVGSSCGEFTKHYYLAELETKEAYQEFITWKNNHLIK